MAEDQNIPRATWPTWLMLIVFTFMSFECVLLAFALKGSWFILLAPGVVCGVKALDTWRMLQKQIGSRAEEPRE